MKPALAAVREQRKLPRAVGRRCTFDIRWRQLGGNNATKSPSRVAASNSLFEHGIAINVDIEGKLSDEAGGAEEQRIVIHSKFQSAQSACVLTRPQKDACILAKCALLPLASTV
jgi:hypothetical protein